MGESHRFAGGHEEAVAVTGGLSKRGPLPKTTKKSGPQCRPPGGPVGSPAHSPVLLGPSPLLPASELFLNKQEKNRLGHLIRISKSSFSHP